MKELETCSTSNIDPEICLKNQNGLQIKINQWIEKSISEIPVPESLDFTELLFSNPSTWIFCASLVLFFSAHRIVRSTTIFYSGGAFLGILSSFVIVAFLLQKLLPRRALSFPLYLGGWPISFYVYYKAWQNFGLLLQNYLPYLIIYVAVMILISFAVCYRFGPPSDVRTVNIIKWALQLLALIGIYFSCAINFLSIATIFLLVTWPFWLKTFNIMNTISKNSAKWLRIKMFGPIPRRLLTEEEFEAESDSYTQMEMEKLKEFCRNSPSTKNWKMISRLSNPRKMASFINGDSDHVTSEEYSFHASALWPNENEDIDVEDNVNSCHLTAVPINNLPSTKLTNNAILNDSFSDFVTDDDDDDDN